jgi:AcrR family transcriptional regulator
MPLGTSQEKASVRTGCKDERSLQDAANLPVIYDPILPIPHDAGRRLQLSFDITPDKRGRRSQILAAIRRLLVERGCAAISVRRIAETSGYSVQTIYNLVGSRNQAIVEAISEYARLVVKMATPRPDDPHAVIGVIDGWLQTIKTMPDFCRTTSMMLLTDSDIWYTFRDLEVECMCDLLAKQQKCGIMKGDVDVKELAEQLITFSSFSCLEWSNRSLPFERLQTRLSSGYASLIADKIEPAYRSAISRHIN